MARSLFARCRAPLPGLMLCGVLVVGQIGCSDDAGTESPPRSPSSETEQERAESAETGPGPGEAAGDPAAFPESPPSLPLSSPPSLPPSSPPPARFAPAEITSAPRMLQKSSEPREPMEPVAPAPATTAGESSTPSPLHLRQLPAGAEHDPAQGFATVEVFYATDRAQDSLPLSAYDVAGNKPLFVLLGGACLLFASVATVCLVRGSRGTGGMAFAASGLTALLAVGVLTTGRASIEKHGVTYTGARGSLVRGVCEVTVPDKHQRGAVERPSLLRFEFHEDQQEHVVLTSVVEMGDESFHTELARTVAASPDRDLLVFIHGFNVGFEAAVRRTAQISVDLPFEGVPVCYSWPSQGTLVGYPIDENNVAWSAGHLKQFLGELVEESGADAINVVAHSMGNRAMTAALQQMWFERQTTAPEEPAPFDRVVLAAPDVDADLFRRDFAPALVDLADQVTLYASSDDQALRASKAVHGYPRAGESGAAIVVVPGVETIDVSGIDLSLLGHSYYGDSESMLRDLYHVLDARLPASERTALVPRPFGELRYWQLLHEATQMR